MLHRVLEKILAHKRGEVAAAKARIPQATLEARVAAAPPARDFAAALRAAYARDGVALIAEVKRKSPSAGLIRPSFRPMAIARAYEAHGAAAISVLTDEAFFGGSLAILRSVRRAVAVPVLRKDFLLDPYQLYEARAAGADAALLIAEALPVRTLRGMLAEARAIGLACLVECHCLSSLKKTLDAGAEIIGINNRDLHTFRTNLDATRRLARHVPRGKLIVSESGIRTHSDVRRVAAWGAHAILVGEALMSQRHIGRAVDILLGRGVKP